MHMPTHKPVIISGFNLLESITVAVIYEMFWLACSWDIECLLDHMLYYD